MWALLAASLIWAFSFGLIKTQLAGVPPHLVAFLRLGLSTLLFLPWCRPGGIPRRTLAMLLLCGAVQYGLMYIAYLASFGYLKASEVALWTIFTPIYVVLFADLSSRTFGTRSPRRGRQRGRGVARVAWKRHGRHHRYRPRSAIQPRLCCRASLVPPPASSRRFHPRFRHLCHSVSGERTPHCDPRRPERRHARRPVRAHVRAGGHHSLPWIPAVRPGIFPRNVGVRRSREGTAAVFNNAKVPLAIAVSWLIFEPFPTWQQPCRTLLALGLITAALWLTEKGSTREARQSPSGSSEPARAERG